MKHLKHLFTTLLLMCATVATSQTFEVDGINYNITDEIAKTVEVASKRTYQGDVIIPSTVNYNDVTYGVTSIGRLAFNRCSGLTSITIPGSVTTIGEMAFLSCRGLKEVYISDLAAWCGIDFKNDNSNPLYCAHNLYLNGELVTELVIPDGVNEIKQYAFYGCSGLTSITIPGSVTSIGDYAFCNCSALTSVTIGNSVTSIGNSAFRGCSELTSITIPNSVTTIGNFAFKGCSSLTSVKIPNSVRSIGDGAFEGCTGLINIVVDEDNSVYDSRDNCNAIIETATNKLIAGCRNTLIPNSVTSIGDYALAGCTGLTSIAIPGGVTSIGKYAFYGCTGLVSITIPNSVTSIGDGAFRDCDGLTSITIGNGVTSIGEYAFKGCTQLNKIINLSNLELQKGSTDYGYIAYYAKEVINIPNGSIEGDFVFGIEDGINTLLDYLGNATELTLPGDYKGEDYIIGNYAFRGCTGLASITIPNSVTSIGEAAFAYCSGLASITIPNSVTSIGGAAFEACPSLKEVHISDLAAWCGIDFEHVLSNPLYYAHNLYLNGELVTELVIPDGVNEIKQYAFYSCTGLTSVTIGNSVTSIGDYAFLGCTGLTSIAIGDSVTSIGDDVFYSCTGLINIIVDEGNSTYDSRDNCNAIIETATNKLIAGCRNTVIPNSVTSIGDYAFYGCSGLTSIAIPNSVNSIGESAFSGCTGLTSVTIPNSVTSIGYYVFGGCTGLTSIEIPNSVTSIGGGAFYGCTGLTNVAIGNGITSIEENAFEKCTGLQTVNISDIASWCSINFANKYSNPLPLAGNLHLNGEKVTELIIPDNVTKIPHYAFMGCTNIESVTIGNKMTTIEEDAFKDCSGLRAVNINDITSWCSISFENEYSNPLSSAGDLYLNGEKVTKLIIPENVTTIAGFAFRSCTSLESLVIGKNVTNIGYEAFCRCSSLTELDIQGAPYLEQAAFSRTGMEEINLPEGITNIHNWGFDSSPNLKSFVIPSTVTSLGHYIFQCCDSLECVISRIPAEELFEAPYAFLGMEAPNCILYVPAGAKEKYETTEGWGEMFAEVREYDEATGIDEPECQNVDIEIVYDLQGRRVKNPGNGIYIINGKKVFVK